VEDIHRKEFSKKTDEQRRLERLTDPARTFESVWNEINDPRNYPTPQSVIEAVLHCVRERGVAALNEPANVERLSRCDEAARAEINHRLAKLEKGKRP